MMSQDALPTMASEESLEVVLKSTPKRRPPPPPEDDLNKTQEEEELDEIVRSIEGYGDVDVNPKKSNTRKCCMILLCIIVLLIIIIPIAVLKPWQKSSDSDTDNNDTDNDSDTNADLGGIVFNFTTNTPSAAVTSTPLMSSTLSPSVMEMSNSPSTISERVLPILTARLSSLVPVELLENNTSPQGMAVARLIEDDDNQMEDVELLQKFSLLSFFYATNGTSWTDSVGWDGTSEDKLNVCEWSGITCEGNRRRLDDLAEVSNAFASVVELTLGTPICFILSFDVDFCKFLIHKILH